MIGCLQGEVIKRQPTGVILKVGGVGYELRMTPADLSQLGSGEETLWVFTRVREDELSLYGFLSYACRQVFAQLILINGIGPKVALAILASVSLDRLREAIELRQIEVLQAVPGIGRKTAEKILLELSGRKEIAQWLVAPGERAGAAQSLEALWQSPAGIRQDVVSALVNLGFKEKDVEKILEITQAKILGKDFGEIVKICLKEMVKAANPKTSEAEAKALNSLF